MLKLVGTLHNDLQGIYRAKCLLEKYKPRKITVECPSNYTIEEMVGLSKLMQEHAAKIAFLDIPEFAKKFSIEGYRNKYYEIITPIQYLSENEDAELSFVDAPDSKKCLHQEVSDKEIESIFKQIDQKIIQDLTNMPLDKLTNKITKLIDNAYYDLELLKQICSLFPVSYTDEALSIPELAEEREEYMFQKISEIMPDIHIGGLAHVFESHSPAILTKKPLYGRLKDEGIAFERMRLCDVNQ